MNRDHDFKHGFRAPIEAQEFLSRCGGKNPHGEPMFRLVRAELRTTREAGVFQEWDDNLSLSEMGGINIDADGDYSPFDNKPLRTTIEMKQVDKYPGMTGWVVEFWCPPHFYGSRGEWESHKVPGFDLPLLGPYPNSGEYELCSQPARELPGSSQLAQVVAEISFHQEQALKYNLATTIKMRVNQMEDEARKKTEQKRAEAKKKIEDATRPFWGSSLAAGRLREGIAARLRAQGLELGHVGA